MTGLTLNVVARITEFSSGEQQRLRAGERGVV